MRTRFRLLWVLMIAGAVAGCATRPVSLSEELRADLKRQTLGHFARAFVLKPAPTETANTRAQRLAPLLLVEAADTNVVPAELQWLWQPDLPEPVISNPPTRPVFRIYYQLGQTTLDGRQHDQVTYVWPYARFPWGKRDQLPAQGIRITLDTSEQPVIWEVLAPKQGARIIFVSQELEAQAIKEFGFHPIVSRYAVERTDSMASQVVVARIIEDGPVVMGPLVYLESRTRQVMTVNCRCMESQAREAAGTAEYELAPLSEPSPRAVRRLLLQAEENSTTSLTNALRLPANY